MPNDILLIAAVAVPVAALTFLRVNAVLVFLSLCLGEVLVHYVAGNANSMLTLFAPHLSSNMLSMVQVVILLLPVVLTAIFMIGTVHGHGKIVLNILPASGVGLLGALLTVPLLPAGQRFSLESLPLWSQLSRLQALIVGVSAIIGLLFLWAQRKRLGASSKE